MRTGYKSSEIRDYIIQQVQEHPREVGILAAKHLGISRQAISRHLKILIESGRLEAVGNTRSRIYRLRPRYLTREQVESLKAKSPARKLELAQQLRREAWELKKASLGQQHPDWSPAQVDRATQKAFLHART